MSMKIKSIIVDDEKKSRSNLKQLLREYCPVIEVVAEAESAMTALSLIAQHKPDLLFLDIEMGEFSGFDLLKLLNGQQNFELIFITAYDKYGIQAVKACALDYLLKPFNYEEFLHAANKALSYAEMLNRSQNHANTTPGAVAAVQPEEEEYLFLKIEYQLVRIALNEILYIEGLKDYVKIYLQDKEKPLLSLSSLKALEEKLPAKRFMRVHRSFIVSLNKINSITRNALQIGKVNITVGDQYKEAFGGFLSKWA